MEIRPNNIVYCLTKKLNTFRSLKHWTRSFFVRQNICLYFWLNIHFFGYDPDYIKNGQDWSNEFFLFVYQSSMTAPEFTTYDDVCDSHIDISFWFTYWFIHILYIHAMNWSRNCVLTVIIDSKQLHVGAYVKWLDRGVANLLIHGR